LEARRELSAKLLLLLRVSRVRMMWLLRRIPTEVLCPSTCFWSFSSLIYTQFMQDNHDIYCSGHTPLATAGGSCARECGLWCTCGRLEGSFELSTMGCLMDCCCTDRRAVPTCVWVSSLDLLVEQDARHPVEGLWMAAVCLSGREDVLIGCLWLRQLQGDQHHWMESRC